MGTVIIRAFSANNAFAEIYCEGPGKPLSDLSHLSGTEISDAQREVYNTASKLAMIGHIETAKEMLETEFDSVLISGPVNHTNKASPAKIQRSMSS